MNLILINAPLEHYGNKRTKDSEGEKRKTTPSVQTEPVISLSPGMHTSHNLIFIPRKIQINIKISQSKNIYLLFITFQSSLIRLHTIPLFLSFIFINLDFGMLLTKENSQASKRLFGLVVWLFCFSFLHLRKCYIDLEMPCPSITSCFNE